MLSSLLVSYLKSDKRSLKLFLFQFGEDHLLQTPCGLNSVLCPSFPELPLNCSSFPSLSFVVAAVVYLLSHIQLFCDPPGLLPTRLPCLWVFPGPLEWVAISFSICLRMSSLLSTNTLISFLIVFHSFFLFSLLFFPFCCYLASLNWTLSPLCSFL